MSSRALPIRRRFLVGVASLAPLAAGLSALPTTAAGYVVRGATRTTYLAAGGAAVFGKPLGIEVKIVLNGKNTYSQRFENGIVWWRSGKGEVDITAGTLARLKKRVS